eukprot:3160267-Rhodomonas_salina.1
MTNSTKDKKQSVRERAEARKRTERTSFLKSLKSSRPQLDASNVPISRFTCTDTSQKQLAA